jgi:dTDP-4-dehydrorhamnose reductase
MTLFQIAQIVNRVGGYDPKLVKGCLRIMAGPMPPRAGNVSMSSAKLVGLMGFNPFQPWPAGEELFPTDRYWHFTRPPEEVGSRRRLGERLYRYPAPFESELLRYNWTTS